MKTKILPMRITQGLFLLNMVIWLVIGGISLARLEDGTNSAFVIVALMVLGNALLMGISAWWLGRRTVWGYLLALALLAINVVTTFTDQVGFADYATVLVDIILLALLIFRRADFLPIKQ